MALRSALVWLCLHSHPRWGVGGMSALQGHGTSPEDHWKKLGVSEARQKRVQVRAGDPLRRERKSNISISV
eukprot:627154-Prorocentrum_minimum.AAC.2